MKYNRLAYQTLYDKFNHSFYDKFYHSLEEVFNMFSPAQFFQVIQRRYDGSVNFTRSWDIYKKGFGRSDGEYWLGKYIRLYLFLYVYSFQSSGFV